MTALEIVLLVVAVIAAGAVFLGLGSSLFRGGTVGPMSIRGRMRGRSERDGIERDHDPTFYAPQGGHQPDPPGMGKPPNKGGLP